MDLRSLANSVSNTVNPNITVSVQRSTGYEVGVGYRQTPEYAPVVTGPAQVQAIDTTSLQLVSNLNIQGKMATIYLRGSLASVVREDSQGGDLVTIAAPAPATYIGMWLVVKVIESWPLWTKAVIVLQEASS